MAVDMFLKLTGINGEAKDSIHKDEIDVLAWSWGESNSGTAHMGGGSGAGKVNVQDISLTKYVDLASSSLIEACAIGKHITEATLTMRKAGTSPLEYIVITLTEVMVSSYSTGGSGGEDRLTENVSLNFAKFKYEYKEQLATGGAGKTGTFIYNIQTNKAGAE
jgi:type VI secretion system secreted protein Hcp